MFRLSGTLLVNAFAVGEGAVWVADTSGELFRIDPGSGRVKSRAALGGSLSAVAVGEGAVWVADSQGGILSRVDPRTGKVVARIDVGHLPSDIAVGEGGVWVAVHPANG